MVHLILTGATGLIGSSVLDAMVSMKDITKISVISRRPVPMQHDLQDPRVRVIIHDDFERYSPDFLDQLKDASGCVWALGISQSKVTPEEYVTITKTMTIKAAEAFQCLGNPQQPFHFVYVSGAGATQQPGLFTPIFGRVKGETETQLANMRNKKPDTFLASSVRPAYIDYKSHEAIRPYIPVQPAIKSTVESVLGAGIRNCAKHLWSPTEPLSRFLAEMAMGKWDGHMQGQDIGKIGDFPLVENTAFRRLSGQE